MSGVYLIMVSDKVFLAFSFFWYVIFIVWLSGIHLTLVLYLTPEGVMFFYGKGD